MKYLIKTLLILLVVFYCLKLLFHVFDDGHQVSYNIGNFDVDETLKVNASFNKDDYFFKLKHENFMMNFQVFTDYNKAKNIITDIKHYSFNGYECVLPIFKGNKLLTDIMCVKNNEINYYHDLSKKMDTSKMKSFINSIDLYNLSDFIDDNELSKSKAETIYRNNLVENHYLAISTYRGVNLINSLVKQVKLFDNDVYKQPISCFTGKYYVVADYNKEYSFNKFYVVNIVNGKYSEIRSYDDISFDSIVQGVIDDSIYLFDTDSQIQYKIDLKKNSVIKVGTKDNIKYYNGTFGKMSLQDAMSGKKFAIYGSKTAPGYVKVDFVGNGKYGYYYFYKKVGNKYSVYRSDFQNRKLKTYLFTTTSLDSVIYLNDYIYYKNDTTWYYYNTYGSFKVLSNSELEFNSDISLGVYIK